MREWQSGTQVKSYSRCHGGIVPKYRRKSMFGVIRQDTGEILKALCRRLEVELVEGHVMPGHAHMWLGIPPKYSVMHKIGKLKGRSTILVSSGLEGIVSHCGAD